MLLNSLVTKKVTLLRQNLKLHFPSQHTNQEYWAKQDDGQMATATCGTWLQNLAKEWLPHRQLTLTGPMHSTMPMPHCEVRHLRHQGGRVWKYWEGIQATYNGMGSVVNSPSGSGTAPAENGFGKIWHQKMHLMITISAIYDKIITVKMEYKSSTHNDFLTLCIHYV